MNLWTVMSPHARIVFSHADGGTLHQFHTELAKVSGCKQSKRYHGWEIPLNAVEVANDLVNRFGVSIADCNWLVAPQPPITWEEVEKLLRAGGEVRSWVLDSFITQYQKDAVTFGWNRMGVNFWHSTGCLTGDTEVVVNRGGNGKKIRLDELVRKFNGGASKDRWGHSRRYWDLTIPTRVQCFKDGFIFLNTLVSAHFTGRKPVFLLTAGGHTIKATADHRFLTANDGWKRLSDLVVGDCIVVRGRQGSKAGPKQPKIIYKLIGVRHHPYASVAKAHYNERQCERGRYRPGYIYEVHRVPEHRLVVEAHRNGLDLSEHIRRCREGGSALEGLVFLDPDRDVVHHLNHDPTDNRLENLEVMTPEEHALQHANEGTWKNVAIGADEAVIESIQPVGTEMTYDLTMEDPHNNYVANGFVVHNSGKTLTGVLTSLSAKGPVIVVTRAVSRIQFAREIERFLTVKAHIVRPVSSGGFMKVQGETWNQYRKRYKGQKLKTKQLADMWAARKEEFGPDKPTSITDYVKACRAVRTRPFIVLGWEAVPDNLAELKSIGATCLIADEAHRGKSVKRLTIVHLQDLPEDSEESRELARLQEKEIRSKGGFIKVTEEGRKAFVPVENMASAVAELARSCRKCISATATPVKDRPRDLWGQLDTVEPNSWGSSTAFRTRYCSMRPGIYGGMDDRGKSNVEELNLRLRSVSHILSYEQTHKHLPPKRRMSVYVAPEDQVAELAGFNKELKDAKKFGASAVLEVRLAIAASRKRKAVFQLIEDYVKSGQKVCIFTARRRDCEELGNLVRKMIGKGSKEQPLLHPGSVWAVHGGDSPDARQAVVDEYMAHPGPCVLVGTGDSIGESLNLDDADVAIIVQLPYTPGQLRQWEGRFHRASTKKPVIICYVIAEGTVDEHIADVIICKLDAVAEIAQDHELAAAKGPLSGTGTQTPDEFATSVLASLDL